MIPPFYTLIAYWCWPVLWIVWFVGYFTTKKTLRSPRMGTYLVTTVILVLGFVLLFSTDYWGAFGPVLTPQNEFFGIIGDVFCVSGIIFAIYARLVLGRSWSGTVATLKEDHVLAQKGPYRIVRHPIYTGFLFAMFGTALTLGLVVNYLGVLLGLVGFLMRIPIEEKLMLEQFPDAYPTYKEKVKMLIPFLW